MTVGGLLAGSLSGWVAAMLAAPRFPRAWLTLNLTGAAGVLGAAFAVLMQGGEWNWRADLRIGGEALHLRLDGLSGLFLVLVAVIGAAGTAYAVGYWSDRERPESAGRGRAWWSGLLVCMALVLVSSNGLHFLMAWEAFALSGYFLITLERDRRETRAAGWLYLAASHAGTLGLFGFFGLLAARTGNWDLGSLRERGDLAPLFWIALFGFGVKAGMFPLHVWLPSAHANAPSHVSAILSGVAIKMGLYGIVRFSGWLPLPPGAAWAVLLLGAVSALLGAAFALAQDDLKRLLAYCSVENVGVILLGVGAGMLGAAQSDSRWGRLAMAGALLHLWNHGLFKSLLFFGAGSVLHATGTREMSRMGGLWRSMPWTASLFAFGAVAISALPPLNGFVSEWLIYLGLFEWTAGKDGVATLTIPAVIALAVTGALALAGFVKASSLVFLGAARTQASVRAHECGWWMRAPMVSLVAVCLVLALGPAAVWPLVGCALGAWNAAWEGTAVPAELLRVQASQGMLAVLGALAVLAIRGRVRQAGVRRGLTWDCGYAGPTARMQYTSGSFGGIVVGWLRRVFRPELRWRRLRGHFPDAACRVERMPDTVLEHVLQPLGAVIMTASEWVRRRQHGRLPDYILYLVAGMAAIGALVFVGGTR